MQTSKLAEQVMSSNLAKTPSEVDLGSLAHVALILVQGLGGPQTSKVIAVHHKRKVPYRMIKATWVAGTLHEAGINKSGGGCGLP